MDVTNTQKFENAVYSIIKLFNSWTKPATNNRECNGTPRSVYRNNGERRVSEDRRTR